MKPARLIVLAIALGAAGLAAMLMMQSTPTETVVVEKVAPVSTVDVLVATSELPVGQTLRPGDLRWQSWPSDYVPTGSITKAQAPGGLEEFTGSIVRQASLAGEPVRREKLVKANSNAFMSAILPSGMRAVAISIDTRGATSAGGFILPNDRVDILRTYRDDEASKSGGVDVQLSETILPNVRILAIGQNIQERNGEKVVSGETATLEVTPSQAEALALAQKTGQLSLALRSLADAGQTEITREDKSDGSVTVVRYGVSRQSARR
ncbi:Flp pilus assembly protein CpaB [uncultured Enterovirga sp.]|uniref:Flp pilus assembly protein CpaB n=1 Tax=uncultured Enterovirga sp. TaxID=2026352 RepID=UPI0035CC5307